MSYKILSYLLTGLVVIIISFEFITNSYQASDPIATNNEFSLPFIWGDLGKNVIDSGIIDESKFDPSPLLEPYDQPVVVNESNARFFLTFFWGLGLANKSPILSDGPISSSDYGSVINYASTGGWPLSRGDLLDHFNKHSLITLSLSQLDLVERVSKNIYRPCCDNPTFFPDCNHGMAMLGLLEVLASSNVSESDMYDIALKFNRLWFPSQYQMIDQYINNNNLDITAKEILGYNYSSLTGFNLVASQIDRFNPTGSSCSL